MTPGRWVTSRAWTAALSSLLLACGSTGPSGPPEVGGTYVVAATFDGSTNWRMTGTLVLAQQGGALTGTGSFTVNLGTGDRTTGGQATGTVAEDGTVRVTVTLGGLDSWAFTGTRTAAGLAGRHTYYWQGVPIPGGWTGTRAGG